jgi:hypothetical protein
MSEPGIRSFLVRACLRCRAKVDVRVTCLTSWASPFTGGYERILPRGEIIRVANDPPRGATAVYAHPEGYRRLHRQMVPLADRAQFWVYRGYHLCIRLSQLETDFEIIGSIAV